MSLLKCSANSVRHTEITCSNKFATFLELAWESWDQFTNRPCKVTKIHSLVTCCLPDEAINSEITDSLIFPSVKTTISQVKLSKYFDTEITHL